MSEKKLYSDDRDIPYSTTKIPPIKTRSDIDAILAKWGITKVMWEFDIENNKVQLAFELPYEKFGESTINPVIKLEPPRIWNKKKRNKLETINWQISMRILHWYIKDSLAMSYAMQSQKAVAFLPYIQTSATETVKDVLLPRLSLLKALPDPNKNKIIEVDYTEG